jgi:hypothetical protein
MPKKRNPSVSERIRDGGGLRMSPQTRRWFGTDAQGALGVLNGLVADVADIPVAAATALGHTIDWTAEEADRRWNGSKADKWVANKTGVHQRPSELIGGMAEAFPMGFPQGSGARAGALSSRAARAARSAAVVSRDADPLAKVVSTARRVAPKAARLYEDVKRGERSSQAPKARTGALSSSRLPGAPALAETNPVIKGVAEDYARKAGINYTPPRRYHEVDEARAGRIADAYDSMRHAPDDPRVKEAYQALTDETLAQYRAAKDAGFKFEFNPGKEDPYGGNPRGAIRDLNANRHLYVFPTDEGFGTLNKYRGNPLEAIVPGETWGDRPVMVNDIFRAVHDTFGHAKEGVGFRAAGEENAFLQHAALYSPRARHAATSETRGQNSWLNYGPYGETNRTAKIEDTIFADQKTGLLPKWAMEQGTEDFLPRDQIAIQHFSHQPDLTETDPAFRGTNPNRGYTSRDDLGRGPMTDFGFETGQPGGYRVEGGVGPYAYEASVPASDYVRVNSPEWEELLIPARGILENVSKRNLAKMRGEKFDGPGDEEWKQLTGRLPTVDNGVGLLDGLAKARGYRGILYPTEASELGSIVKTWDRVPVLRKPSLDKR